MPVWPRYARNTARPPNIIHLMWDDQPFGAVGIRALQQIRGYSTPRLNQMADEGMLFTRMYSQPSCTPTRDAAMTGQIPVRNGMYKVGFPIEYRGLSKNTRDYRQRLVEGRLRDGVLSASGIWGTSKNPIPTTRASMRPSSPSTISR